MRALILLALLAVAAGAQAEVGTRTWSDGPECHTDASGWTCAATSEKRTGASTDDGAAGVWLVEQTRWSHGNHSSESDNAWNSSRQARGVAATAGGYNAEVLVGLREYRATQEADGKTRRTTDNSVEVEAATPAGSGTYRVGMQEHRVEGSYAHCVVNVLDLARVEVACGQELLDESPLP